MFEGVLLYVEEGGLEYSLRWEFGVWYLFFEKNEELGQC